MDKGMNKKDLIAAGRKKLQQFQRKSGKKSKGQGKSSNKSIGSADLGQSQTDGVNAESSFVNSPLSEVDSQREMHFPLELPLFHSEESVSLNSTTADPFEEETDSCDKLSEKKLFIVGGGIEPADASTGSIRFASPQLPVQPDDESHACVDLMVLGDSPACLDSLDASNGMLSALAMGPTDQEAQEAGCLESPQEINHRVRGNLENEVGSVDSGSAICPVLVAGVSRGPYDPIETINELESIHINSDTCALPYNDSVHNLNRTDEWGAMLHATADVQALRMRWQNGETVTAIVEDNLIGEGDIHLYSPLKCSDHHEISESRICSCSEYILSTSTFVELLEKLKERLYVTNIVKDFVELQFSHYCLQQIELDCRNHDLAEEISIFRISIIDVQSQNKLLSEELTQCRHEIVSVCDERDGLHNQLVFLSSEMKTISGRNNDLQMELDKSQSEFTGLSLEFAKCKESVSNLLVQNEKLKGDLSGLTFEIEHANAEKVNLAKENENLLLEITESKHLVNALQIENSDLNEKMALLLEETSSLKECRESFLCKEEKIMVELADCRDLVKGLRVENTSLTDRLHILTEERNNFAEANEFAITENDTLLLENIVWNEVLFMWIIESTRHEHENLQSKNDLEQQREEQQNEGQDVTSRVQETNIGALHAGNKYLPQNHATVTLLPQGVLNSGSVELNCVDDDCLNPAVQGRLQEAEKIIQELYASIEQMHSHSAFLRKSGGAAASAGVSKLIQAFESKSQVVDGNDLAKDLFPSEYFLPVKNLIRSLEAIIVALTQDTLNASKIIKSERGSLKLANTALDELSSQHKNLEEHSDIVESWSIEVEVLHEVLKQNVSHVEQENTELEMLCGHVVRENSNLKVLNGDLSRRAISWKLKINELLTKLHEVRINSEEVSCTLLDQVKSLRKELVDRVSFLGHKFGYFFAQINEKFDKLNASIGVSSSTGMTCGRDALDACSHIEDSVGVATELIESLQEKFESTCINLEVFRHALMEVDKNYFDLQKRSNWAINMLCKIHEDLWTLVDGSSRCEEENECMASKTWSSPLDFGNYEVLLKHLASALESKNELESVNSNLSIDLSSKIEEIEELKKGFVDPNLVHKLIEDIGFSDELEDGGVTPSEHLICSIVLKYKDAKGKIGMLKEKMASKDASDMQEIFLLYLQQDVFILVLKENLVQAEMAFDCVHSEIQKKELELDQSEQRVYSFREKLSLAVAKGKGLIVQRDNLKQSLAETTSKLERCSEDLNAKYEELSEVEEKLKAYAEAGERAEALESELSYIRNSAMALRESFLHKDSLLQRIEENLDDLKLPEVFHSKDTVEKIDWLARLAVEKSFSVTDWFQKSSVATDSCSDAIYVLSDSCEDVRQELKPDGDLKRKLGELQSQFYVVSEQNEMLEQSLMERNHMVQRWENIISKINFPMSVQSMEPEDKIEWLGATFFESHHLINELRHSIVTFETHNTSLNAEVDESKGRIADLRAAFEDVITEKDSIYRKLEELENENAELQKNYSSVQESFHEKNLCEERIKNIEERIKILQDLIVHAMQHSHKGIILDDGDDIELLEKLLEELIEKYRENLSVKPVLGDDDKILEQTIAPILAASMQEVILQEVLDAANGGLVRMNEEKEEYVVKYDMLVSEVEVLSKKKQELQHLLTMEEQKTASLREKLNVAVRKGKLLVQQRDGLKGNIEILNAELNQLRAENSHQKNSISEYSEKLNDLHAYTEKIDGMNSEASLLRSRLADLERILAEREETIGKITGALCTIDASNEVNNVDPIEKLKNFLGVFNGLRESLSLAEHESRKSRRAAELLLTELNEVQERNDSLQEELANSMNEISTLSKGRDMAEATKLEALSHVDELYSFNSEKMKRMNSVLVAVKLRMDAIKRDFYDINGVFAHVSSKDAELLQDLQAAIRSYSEGGATDSLQLLLSFQPTEIFSLNLERKNETTMEPSEIWMQGQFGDNDILGLIENQINDIIMMSGNVRENLHKHVMSLSEGASKLVALVLLVQKTLNSQEEAIEHRDGEISRLEAVEKQKEVELTSLHRNASTLFQACLKSIQEIENSGDSYNKGLSLELPSIGDEEHQVAGPSSYTEHEISDVANKLLSAVKYFLNMQVELVGQGQKDLKLTISSLQKELQEKDVQREKTCTGLVQQVKKAEADAAISEANYHSAQAQVQDLEERVKELEASCRSLEKHVKELQDREAELKSLEEAARSLTDTLGSKEHEIEDLMEALNDDEFQIGELRNKIQDLNSILQKKDIDLAKAEASHAKAKKKLSITISRFDELHQLSDDLLSEVEKLQSQLRDRDQEISFLRQEVTRCTNEVLGTPAVYNKKHEDEIRWILTCFDDMISRVQVNDMSFDVKKDHQLDEYIHIVGKQIETIVSELEALRAATQANDVLLQAEREKVEDLQRREPTTSTASEIHNAKLVPTMEEWPKSSAAIVPQVRSLRKANSDHISIAVADPSSDATLVDDDDDKVHGFKSLTTSCLVPKFTRPVSDLVDGLWVSCDRALMRQPAFRLGIIFYWSLLHALLATHMV